MGASGQKQTQVRRPVCLAAPPNLHNLRRRILEKLEEKGVLFYLRNMCMGYHFVESMLCIIKMAAVNIEAVIEGKIMPNEVSDTSSLDAYTLTKTISMFLVSHPVVLELALTAEAIFNIERRFCRVAVLLPRTAVKPTKTIARLIADGLAVINHPVSEDLINRIIEWTTHHLEIAAKRHKLPIIYVYEDNIEKTVEEIYRLVKDENRG